MHGTLLSGSKHNSIHVRPRKKHRVQRDANIRGYVQDMVTSVPIGLGRDPGSTFALQAALRPGTHAGGVAPLTIPPCKLFSHENGRASCETRPLEEFGSAAP